MEGEGKPLSGSRTVWAFGSVLAAALVLLVLHYTAGAPLAGEALAAAWTGAVNGAIGIVLRLVTREPILPSSVNGRGGCARVAVVGLVGVAAGVVLVASACHPGVVQRLKGSLATGAEIVVGGAASGGLCSLRCALFEGGDGACLRGCLNGATGAAADAAVAELLELGPDLVELWRRGAVRFVSPAPAGLLALPGPEPGAALRVVSAPGLDVRVRYSEGGL